MTKLKKIGMILMVVGIVGWIACYFVIEAYSTGYKEAKRQYAVLACKEALEEVKFYVIKPPRDKISESVRKIYGEPK